MDDTEAEVERHNEQSLWQDVAGRLTAAREELEIAQGLMEDLHKEHLAVGLVEHADGIERFRVMAQSKANDLEYA